MPADRPEVSIIMPVRNEARAIETTLDAVLAQVLDAPFEVVVAEGRSVDDTRAILERRSAADPRLRIVDNPDGGIPQALNRLLAAARGRYLVRVDGHSRVPPDFVQRLVEHLRAGRCEAAGGILRGVGSNAFGRAVAAVHGSPLGIGDAKHHYSTTLELVDHVAFPAYVTNRVRALGGWDERLAVNEDYEFNYRYRRAGGRILLDPSVVFDWNVRETPGALARQYFRYGFGKFRSLALWPSSLRPRWLVPPGLVLVLAAGSLLSWTGPGRILLASAVAAYALFVAVAAAALASRDEARSAPRIALALALLQLSWGAGFAASALTLPVATVARRLGLRSGGGRVAGDSRAADDRG